MGAKPIFEIGSYNTFHGADADDIDDNKDEEGKKAKDKGINIQYSTVNDRGHSNMSRRTWKRSTKT